MIYVCFRVRCCGGGVCESQLIGGYWLELWFELIVAGDVAVCVVRKAAFLVHWTGRVGG
jgi:hypothetical protein